VSIFTEIRIEKRSVEERPAFSVYKRWNKQTYLLMARHQDYKFVHLASGKNQLYNLALDPGEYQNLFKRSGYEDITQQFLEFMSPMLLRLYPD
jgi:hypothetical protein